MHRLLQRQIQHFLGATGATLGEEFRSLFEAISEAYERADSEHFTVEHAMETVSRELTERNNDLRLKLAEHQVVARALHLSELNLRKAQEIAKVGSWFLDTRERRLQWSEEFKHILGISDDEPLLYDHNHDKSPPGNEAFSEEIWSCIFSEKSLEVERRLEIGGEIKWVRIRSDSVYDDDGELIGKIGTIQDITESRHVAEQLRLAKERAEEATQTKSMFLANMSHEIRTPLNAIIGMTYLTLKTELSPKQRDYLEKIHNAGALLRQIVDDILDFTKIEANKMEIEQTGFPLTQLFDHISSLFADRIEEKGIKLVFSQADNAPRNLIGDPLRLGQVLTNLVSNAVKFTERGEILLKVEVLGTKTDKIELRFTVRDTGIGMTAEQAGRVFNAFTQADGSTTRKYGGTGLGLMICKRLVELMNGRIEVESQPGVGSAFHFSVWLGRGNEAPVAYPDSLKDLRILLVDDSDLSRQAILECLRSFPFTSIDEAASGEEALRTIRQMAHERPYNVVFMDWQMPGIDGIETTRRIKNDPELKNKPAIVMVTLSGGEDFRRKAEDAGTDAFLLKPVNRAMLLDSLVEIFAPGKHARKLVAKTRTRNFPLDGMSILLAEDNEVNQQLATALLEEAGAHVEVAANGREAMEKLFNGNISFDMVLMDLQMPEMDGYQATAAIRANPRFKEQPIIAMTAHALTDECQRSREAGMDGHITKPIEPEVLYETLAKWHTSNKKSTRPAPPKAEPPIITEPGNFPAIPGINTSDGLRRSAGNARLYHALLLQFAERQADAVERIDTSLREENLEQARHAAHAVKGVAGTLGAMALSEAAAQLETALHSHDLTAIPVCFERFSAAMNAVLASIRQVLSAVDTPH